MQPIANSVRMHWCANHMPSLPPACRAEIELSPAHSYNSLPTTSVAGAGTYDSAATIRLGATSGTAVKALKENMLLNWTGAFTILAIGPSPSNLAPDGRP